MPSTSVSVVLRAFEAAERADNPEQQQAWLTFVIVGAGPTGVELAGALAEMAHMTLRGEFRHINPADATVLLVEGTDRVLPPYPADLSAKAQRSLEKLGVTVRTQTFVTEVDDAWRDAARGRRNHADRRTDGALGRRRAGIARGACSSDPYWRGTGPGGPGQSRTQTARFRGIRTSSLSAIWLLWPIGRERRCLAWRLSPCNRANMSRT